MPSSTAIPSRPIPTTAQKEPTEITLELLRTNNGCELPCWWGIIPDQTRWSDAEDFLKPFSNIYERQPPSEWFVYDVRSPIAKTFSELGEIRATYAVRGGTVKELEVSEFDEDSYHLASFLQKHGVPSEVYISSFSSDYGLPPNQVPFGLNLYYPEKGVNALYGTYAMVNGAQIEGCLDKSPILFLWSPEDAHRSMEYILGWDQTSTPYLDVETAIGLSIQEFFDKYSNPENSPCLQTPTILWPSQ
jgi:hypothetical protein